MPRPAPSILGPKTVGQFGYQTRNLVFYLFTDHPVGIPRVGACLALLAGRGLRFGNGLLRPGCDRGAVPGHPARFFDAFLASSRGAMRFVGFTAAGVGNGVGSRVLVQPPPHNAQIKISTPDNLSLLFRDAILLSEPGQPPPVPVNFSRWLWMRLRNPSAE